VPLSLERFKFVGGSPMILTKLFTIQAKGEPGHDSLAMLRTLLAERFGLRIHKEVRDLPVMALIRRDRPGPNFRPSPYNCHDLLKKEVAEGRRIDLANEHCRPRIPRRAGLTFHWTGRISDLISTAAQPFIERPVVDMTGLDGTFEWDVNFVPIDSPRSDLPTILSAFEDQLGLKFESRIGPYEVMVIDDVRMPTPN
jgi:uncharacterized protein (TIGR03435 family)